MRRTRESKFLVTTTSPGFVRLQVLNGDDNGIRVTIPVRYLDNATPMDERLQELSPGDVVDAILVRDGRTWEVESMSRCGTL